MKRVLVCNDDGIEADGIKRLAAALEPSFEVWVVAPDREQSARSHAITLEHPLRVSQVAPRWFAVNGTPTDAVYVGINYLLEKRVDMVVSGINHGPNMGDDVTYSGTVAVALEACMSGIPAIAISLVGEPPLDFDYPAEFARSLVLELLSSPERTPGLLNVNVPNLPRHAIRGVRVTRLGLRVYGYGVEKRQDPRGGDYYWIGAGHLSYRDLEGSDFNAIEEGFVSVTPLRRDFTDHRAVERLAWLNDVFQVG